MSANLPLGSCWSAASAARAAGGRHVAQAANERRAPASAVGRRDGWRERVLITGFRSRFQILESERGAGSSPAATAGAGHILYRSPRRELSAGRRRGRRPWL